MMPCSRACLFYVAFPDRLYYQRCIIRDLYSQGTQSPREILLENKRLQFPMLSIMVETEGTRKA